MSNSLLSCCRRLFGWMARAIPDPRPQAKVLDLAVALLCSPKPKTLTSALSWLEAWYPYWHDPQDWSDDYRLWSKTHWSLEDLFFPLLFEAVALSPPAPGPLYSAQDDTLIRKSGRRIPGTSILRDPLSPAFHVNLVLGQRFLQTSVLLPTGGLDRPWRSIPVRFRHAPPLKARRGASPEEKADLRRQRKKHNLCVSAAQELQALRVDIDQLPHGADRLLIHAVDGGYANKTFLGQLPPRIQVVARIRKDAKLRALLPSDPRKGVGSKKYGAPLPTPEQYRQDDQIPWQPLEVFVAGQERTLHYKRIGPLCWPKGTGDRPVGLIVVKAAGYRLRKGSSLLYRQPAFLLISSPELSVELFLKAFLGRWEVEVNFRDEKHGLGVGQAQVWNPQAVARAPAFLVACYAALLLSSIRMFQDRRTQAFGPLARWRKTVPLRPSIRDLIKLLTKEAKVYFATLSPAVAA